MPLGLKIVYTIWFVAWVPTYWVHYGPTNFLWLCDVGNFVLLVALWRESRLLASSQLLAALIPDGVWALDLAGAVVTGTHPIGGTEYMFDASIPVFVRGLSLFHLFVPLVLLWMVRRLGYDARGLWLQTAVTSVVLPLGFLLADAEANINWVYGPFGVPQTRIAPVAYLGVCLLAYPLGIYLPTHALISRLLRHRSADGDTDPPGP